MYKLSMFQVLCVTSTSILPLLFWIYPRYAASEAGIDGQWAVFGACLIALFSAWVHGMLNERFARVSGADMPSIVFGKVIGKIVNIFFIPGYVLFLATSIYSFSISVKSVLPNTPRLATVIALTLVAVVGALYGLETLARVASVVFPVVTIVLGASFIFVFFRGSWTGVIWHPVNLHRSIFGSAQLLTMFFGLNLFLTLSPYYDHRKRNSIWLVLGTVGFASVTVLVIYIITLRVVGYQGLMILAHPVDFVLRLVQLQGLFIQRFGVVLLFTATMYEGLFFANHLWSLAETTQHLLNWGRNRQKWFVLFYAIAAVVVFRIIPNQQVGDEIVKRVLTPLAWAYLVIEPTVKLIVMYIRGKNLPYKSYVMRDLTQPQRKRMGAPARSKGRA